MLTIKIAAIVLAVLGLGAAMIAAAYWWRASRIAILEPVASISDVPEFHLLSTQVAYNESSRLNSRAPVWTGAAAIVSATASVPGVL
jgi:hypothetical protein